MDNDKKNIGLLFDRIAVHYDSFNHLLSLNIDKLWRRKLVKQIAPAQSVLDVAIGTGDLAIALIRSGKIQHVTGIDLSQEMMRIGEKKAETLPIDFVHGSALEMPFQDASFDAVTCSFGCRNFSNLQQGLNEMLRVLKQGGEVCILEFSYPSNPIIRWAYDIYFSCVMPKVGALMSKDESAYQYFNHSVKHFIWGEKFANEMRQVGFVDVKYRALSLGIATLYYGCKAK